MQGTTDRLLDHENGSGAYDGYDFCTRIAIAKVQPNSSHPNICSDTVSLGVSIDVAG